MLVEMLLQLLVCEVDAELLKVVDLELLEAVDVQDTHDRPRVLYLADRLIDLQQTSHL
jgi:hypothetical protein